MTEKFATIRPEWTVAETLDHLKRIDPEVETVQSLYAVDEDGPARRLRLAAPALPRAAGQEDRRHDGAAPPDGAAPTRRRRRSRASSPSTTSTRSRSSTTTNRLLGIVTVDDVIDILIEEQTEDVLHMGGVSATEETVEQGYFATKPLPQRARCGSTGCCSCSSTETFTGTVLRHYESELAKVVALSFFIPLLIGTGGNSGSQTVTTIVRGLAVGEIRLRDFGRVLLREAGSGLVLGLMLGVVGFGRALLWGSTMPLAMTVGVSILVDLRLGQHRRLDDPDARDRCSRSTRP